MLEEMQNCLPGDEHLTEKDDSGKESNDMQARQHPQQVPPDENAHSQGSHYQKERRAAEHFTKGVLTRGEAVKSQDGGLPCGATHEIVETKEGELPKIRRRRFSLI